MKPALLLTLCLASLIRADEPAAAPAATTVPGNPPEQAVAGQKPEAAAAGTGAPAAPRFQIVLASEISPAQQQVNASLPKYDPAAPKEAGTVGTPSPDAIELPMIKVTPKRRPRLTPEIVITNKGLEQKAAPVDKLLNSSGLLGGASAAERAREEQERKKKAELTADVDTIAKAVETVDPAQAKALRDAVSKP
jgi:hypothetical protein